MTQYRVTNRHTGKVRYYKTMQRARRAADRGDMEYGAICCSVARVDSVLGEVR